MDRVHRQFCCIEYPALQGSAGRASAAPARFGAQQVSAVVVKTEVQMPEPERGYDIFRGSALAPVRVGAASGLIEASERMSQLAAEKPDFYFVFDAQSHLIVAQIDRTPEDRYHL
jgi:hypothetical protein